MKKFLSILILAVFATTIAILVYSVAFGQDMMLEAVIKDNKIAVYKITKTKLETTLLPNTELGISIEDAKKVCLASTGRIATTEETNKKINFWTFPTVKTKTVVEKKISYDKSRGWENTIVKRIPSQETKWSWSFLPIVLFVCLLGLNLYFWGIWRQKYKIRLYRHNLAKIHLGIFVTCCMVMGAVETYKRSCGENSYTIEAMMLYLFLFCLTIMVFAIIKTIKNTFNLTYNGIVTGCCTIALLYSMVISYIAVNNNSAKEFLGLLAGMMVLSFVVSWLIYLGKKLLTKKIPAQETKP